MHLDRVEPGCGTPGHSDEVGSASRQIVMLTERLVPLHGTMPAVPVLGRAVTRQPSEQHL